MNGEEMHQHAITIRQSNHSDQSALTRLAALDDRPAFDDDDVLLGFVDGELKAAVTLSGGQAIADPFVRTAELVELLRLRATQEPAPRSGPAREHGVALRRFRWAA
jgi:hypothetical protein